MADEKETKDKSIEEKAEEIVKALPEEKEEPVPDFEVTEESSEEVEGDKRLGKTREGDERPRLSNREKRQQRKKRIADKFDAKDRLIRQQQEMINELAQRQNANDSRISQIDQAQLEQAWNDTAAVFTTAEAEYANAFKTQDGGAAATAMRKMYDAQKRLDELQAINARRQQQPAQKPAKADPIMVSKATDWAKRNEWFRADGGDDDSAIANTIAAKLVKEGFDATSDDYWDELDERLAARGIGDVDDEPEPQPKKRVSPPVGGSGGRGDLGAGKTSITLPTAYINALKESGKWDDKPTRDRMIKRYLEGLKQRESEGAR